MAQHDQDADHFSRHAQRSRSAVLRSALTAVLRILTDRGTEYCGRAKHRDYELCLAVNDIEHTKTKAQSPQTNAICERFHKTLSQEFYQVTFRRKIYTGLVSLQADLDDWLVYHRNYWRFQAWLQSNGNECSFVYRVQSR